MSHYILKLTSGEFVYGIIDTIKTDKKMVVLENPLTWEEYETGDGQIGSALVKFVNGSSETSIPIATTAIVSISKMSKVFEDFYDAAVACQQITDEAYDEKISFMTRKMIGLVMEYQAKAAADALGKDSIVAFKKPDSDITFH